MAVKIILLDLDGTLLDNNKQISPANRAALERAVREGIHVVPSTGRFYDGMPQVVRDLPFVRYVITVNGAQIYDAVEKKVLHSAEISPEAALSVYECLDQLPVIYDSFIDGWGYMDSGMYAEIDTYISDPRVNRMVKELRKPVESLKDYVRSKACPVQKIQMFFESMEQKQPAWDMLIRKFPQMAVTSSITNNVELNDQHANKGEALQFLCEYLGVDIRDTISFGDGSNDLSMIRAAGIGVAMENASESLKAEADYITASNEDDGVAKALKKFCFI